MVGAPWDDDAGKVLRGMRKLFIHDLLDVVSWQVLFKAGSFAAVVGGEDLVGGLDRFAMAASIEVSFNFSTFAESSSVIEACEFPPISAKDCSSSCFSLESGASSCGKCDSFSCDSEI
jgi:hypothetical protein